MRGDGALPPSREARLVSGISNFASGCYGLFANFIETELRSELVIAWSTVGFGLLLWWANHQSGRGGFAKIRVKEAVVIGLAQALALIGTSRSGILWRGSG